MSLNLSNCLIKQYLFQFTSNWVKSTLQCFSWLLLQSSSMQAPIFFLLFVFSVAIATQQLSCLSLWASPKPNFINFSHQSTFLINHFSTSISFPCLSINFPCLFLDLSHLLRLFFLVDMEQGWSKTAPITSKQSSH